MKNIIIIICFLTILLVTFVNAFAVTSFYYEGYPLILNPGQTKDIQLLLQNEKTSKPTTIKTELNSDIAELTGRTVFDLKTGEIDIPIKIRVIIPETAKIGDEYSVNIIFTTLSKPGNEMLGLNTQITKSIPIVIGKIIESKKSFTDIIPIKSISGTLAILALIILVMFILKRKKKKK